MVPGGDLYPTLIRKNPIKPLRIFFQDGSADLDNEHGNWFLANQQMLAALEYANRTADSRNTPGPRYELNHVWAMARIPMPTGDQFFRMFCAGSGKTQRRTRSE
jgi:hypothetical protein